MIKKFECKECKQRFEADDSKIVNCPHCHSDNVEYSSFHIPSWVWKSIGGIIILIGLLYCIRNIDWNEFWSKNKSGQSTESSYTTNFQLDNTYIEETGLELPPEIEISTLNYIENKGYSFNVALKNIEASDIYIAILDPYNDNKVIAKSRDGAFTNIPYSNVDGNIYTLAVFNAKNDTIICKKEQVPGFVKQEKVSKKLSIDDLQSKINHRDESLIGVGKNDYLSPNYKLTFTGLPKDAINKPQNLYEVFEKLDMETWIYVKVSSLQYDDMNRISEITLIVKESNDNF